MQHMLAFGNSTPGAQVNVQLNAIPEQVFTRANNRFQIPQQVNLVAAYAAGISMTRARINTASLRLRGFPQIVPFENLALPPKNPDIMDFRDWPLTLKVQEDVEIDATRVAGAGAENHYAALIVSDGPLNMNMNARDLRWIHGSAQPTQVAFNWSAPNPVVFEDTLEGGLYNIYGMQCTSASTVFARLILQNQVWRPGCLGMGSNLFAARSAEMFRGGLGLWGQFSTYSVPQVECVGDVAGLEALDVHLLVAKAA